MGVIIHARASWEVSAEGLMPRLKLDTAEISNKLDTVHEGGQEADKIIVDFSQGDKLFGIPIEYKTD